MRTKLDREDQVALINGFNRALKRQVRFTAHAFDRVYDRFRSSYGIVDPYIVTGAIRKLASDPIKLTRLFDNLALGKQVAVCDKDESVQILLTGTEEISVISVINSVAFKNQTQSGKLEVLYAA